MSTIEGDYLTIYTTPQKTGRGPYRAVEKEKIAVESAEVSMIAKQTIGPG